MKKNMTIKQVDARLWNMAKAAAATSNMTLQNWLIEAIKEKLSKSGIKYKEGI